MPGENSDRILVFIRATERGRARKARGGGERVRLRAGEGGNGGGEVSIVLLRPRGLGAFPPFSSLSSLLAPLRSLSYYYYFLSQYLLFPHSVLC